MTTGNDRSSKRFFSRGRRNWEATTQGNNPEATVGIEAQNTSGIDQVANSPNSSRQLPPPEQARDWLQTMLLIRRFEERAGEMYARAKIGGFLHLAIGEEATVVGTVEAMDESDYMIATYRDHGQPIARGTNPNVLMAELFGREGGCCKGRGGSMHMFDLQRRFMGGYGIVGGNLPIAAGIALQCKYQETGEVVVCQFGDGASNQGTFGETLNMATLWNLPIVFQVTNNQFGMGTSLERHSGITSLKHKGEGFGVPGVSCDGMDVIDTYEVTKAAIEQARKESRPVLVEAVTYRFRGHSMADPEEYRTKEEVLKWRQRDPITTFRQKLLDAKVISEQDYEEFDRKAVKRVDEAVEFADNSPFPAPESIYDDIYVFGNQVRGWYSIDERSAGVHRGEHEREHVQNNAGGKS